MPGKFKLRTIDVYMNYLRLHRINNRELVIVLSVFVGLAGGMVAYLLKTAVYYIHHILLENFQFDRDNLQLLLYPALGIGFVVLMKRFLLKDWVKHNISAILYAISKRSSIMKAHKSFSSFIGGIITAGFGGSIGLESPIISSGAALGSMLGKYLRLNYKTITLLLACGASGAISAIFNTPIAAVVFALEILLIDLTRFSLIPLLVASLSGALFPAMIFPDEILFQFTASSSDLKQEFVWYALLGIVCGLYSCYFTHVFIWVEKKFENVNNKLFRWIAGSLILGLLLYLFPALYGEGYETIKTLLADWSTGNLTENGYYMFSPDLGGILMLFVFLLLFKVVAASVTVGSGGIGGVFAPSLFSGALLGSIYVHVQNFLGNGNLHMGNFILVAMAGVLSGVLHAPLTSIFLIVEMTQGYELIVPLMMVSVISFLTVKLIQRDSIFTVQLAKRGELITHHKDKAVLTFLELEKVLETDLKSIMVGSNLGDLVKVIAKSNRNMFPVIDEDGLLHGVIYLEKVREIMFNKEMYTDTYVENLMDLPPAYIYSSDSMDEVMKKFTSTNAWNLPVIENAKYKGFVSKSKLFTAYRKLLLEISED